MLLIWSRCENHLRIRTSPFSYLSQPLSAANKPNVNQQSCVFPISAPAFSLRKELLGLHEGRKCFVQKLCQDREQLILTILNMLTSQCSEKINAGGAARERQERRRASRNNGEDWAGLRETSIQFENVKLVFLKAHLVVDSSGSAVLVENVFYILSDTPCS